MITKDNLKSVLSYIGFHPLSNDQDTYSIVIDAIESTISVDFRNEKITYPEGVQVDRDTTVNFSKNENFVVLECVIKLFKMGYLPEHIVLEPKTPGGREDSYYYGDILVRDNDKRAYLLIECKTTEGKEDDEFHKAWRKTLSDGDQLFNYYNTYRQAQYLCLYTSDFVNGQVQCNYFVITMTDNKDYLSSNPHLLSFDKVTKDNGTRDDFFRVWSETYKKGSASKGAFEEKEVSAFGIQKKKLTIDDLAVVSFDGIKLKYNRFASILRQHNVASHENAFDKLVNLFLVKVVDEVRNPQDLQFAWKGAAYDNYYSFQDRLQKLYQIGMKEYLGEEVTYIDNSSIENAFRMQKNDPDAIKDTILNYFRQLKFFSNSDFGFLDVHNETLFNKNSTILIDIVEMLQDIRLKTDKQNQFLGDLFEGFLDQGVKQNEGQFFTPTPITRFMVSSLPLERIVSKQKSIPRVIDYACGAGHFLNEFASQIKPFVIQYKGKEKLHDYYSNIYGIEKEYRLSKVSKVSSFMYDQDGIQIVYGDALIPSDNIKDGQFDVLIANPPYSVPGFLTTIPKEIREKYETFSVIDAKAIETNDFIESFFVERAKQLLAPDGLAAIILPSTVLTGSSNIYMKTREILLKYFDFVAISCFGDGMFGKTGTNTHVLFLRRKKSDPDDAKHFLNRVRAWFRNDHSQDNRYKDFDVVRRYTEHISINYEDYLSLLEGTPSDSLFESELFEEYKETFSNDSDAKRILNKKISSRYTQEMKDKELDKHVISSIVKIETEKLYYFMLCTSNKESVVVMQSPINEKKKDKVEQEFLGYEWSSARRREGIHYLNTAPLKKGDNEIETFKELEGLEKIVTPLFNPTNFNDEKKINIIIRKNYQRLTFDVPESLSGIVKTSPLVDMIDFSSVTFDKAITPNPQHQIEIDTAYDCPKLGSIVHLNEFDFNPKKSSKQYVYVDISSVEKNTGKISFDTIVIGNQAPGRARRIAKDKSVLISTVRPNLKGFAYLPEEKTDTIFSTGFAIIRSKDEAVLRSKYLYYLFMYLDVIMAQMKAMMPKGAYPSINEENIKKIRIPLPPPEIQDEVIIAIESIEKKFNSSRMSIEELNNKANAVFLNKKIINTNVEG
jgi:type I restriction-modification system DNA methylase subunit